MSPSSPIPHGTPGGYTNHRCRCERCRAAWRDYHRKRGYQQDYRSPFVIIGGREFKLTRHALLRYCEREARSLTTDRARRELRASLAERGEIHLTAPAWAHLAAMAGGPTPDEYVTLDDRLVFPVRGGWLLTCVAPSTVGASVRWVA